jgi:hypothetical protein
MDRRFRKIAQARETIVSGGVPVERGQGRIGLNRR